MSHLFVPNPSPTLKRVATLLSFRLSGVFDVAKSCAGTDKHLQEEPTSERKQRKSVAFAQGETLIDGNGEVHTNANGSSDKEDKSTAESHSQGMFELPSCHRCVSRDLFVTRVFTSYD